MNVFCKQTHASTSALCVRMCRLSRVIHNRNLGRDSRLRFMPLLLFSLRLYFLFTTRRRHSVREMSSAKLLTIAVRERRTQIVQEGRIDRINRIPHDDLVTSIEHIIQRATYRYVRQIKALRCVGILSWLRALRNMVSNWKHNLLIYFIAQMSILNFWLNNNT